MSCKYNSVDNDKYYTEIKVQTQAFSILHI